MTKMPNSKLTTPLEEARKTIQERLQGLKNESLSHKPKIIRVETPIQPVNILNWLLNQKDQTKIYWSGRDNDLEVSGVGLAYALHGTNVIDYEAVLFELSRYFTTENRNLRFFGGFAFHQKSLDENWRDFGTYRFVVPRWEVGRRDQSFFLAFNIYFDPVTFQEMSKLSLEFDALNLNDNASHEGLSKFIRRCDEPTQEHWIREVQSVLQKIKSGNLKKAVLARKSTFEFENTLDPISLLLRLRDFSSDCYHFCFQVNNATAFIGASPERLYQRKDRHFKTEALAGTRPPGDSSLEDQKLKNELFHSRKEHLEHNLVVEAIQDALREFCQDIHVDPKMALLAIKGGHHLLTGFEGLLSHDIHDAMILKSLHPTPAVAGTPTRIALKTIERQESFKRGWYAGPVGCVGFNECEFAVAIRCGLISDKKLHLYAGAGIVEGSDPEEEWNEIESKISNFVKIFKNEFPLKHESEKYETKLENLKS